jgi:cytochrome bd ubiquinol oxidase subunit I
LAVSSLSYGAVLTTLIGFVVIYSTLAVIEVGLLRKIILAGPYQTPTDHASKAPGAFTPAYGK